MLPLLSNILSSFCFVSYIYSIYFIYCHFDPVAQKCTQMWDNKGHIYSSKGSRLESKGAVVENFCTALCVGLIINSKLIYATFKHNPILINQRVHSLMPVCSCISMSHGYTRTWHVQLLSLPVGV